MSLINELSPIADCINQGTNNRGIIIKALTNDLKVKTLTILFNSEDEWNEHSMFAANEYIHSNCVQTILNDKTVLGYKTFFCHLNNAMQVVRKIETEPQATRFFKTS